MFFTIWSTWNYSSATKEKPGSFGSPSGQQHLFLDHSTFLNNILRGNSLLVSLLETTCCFRGSPDLEIGEFLFGKPNL